MRRLHWWLPVGVLGLLACVVRVGSQTTLHRQFLFGAIALNAVFMVRVVYMALRHMLIVRGLRRHTAPQVIWGIPARVGELRGSAFVAGLFRGQVYCDRRLQQSLTDRELQAVVYHEREHARRHDPARTLLLAALSPALRYSDPTRGWMERRVAMREARADAAAVRAGASRAALAGALLKVAKAEPSTTVGYTSAVDLRLQALIGEEPFVKAPRSEAAALCLSLLAVVFCVFVL